MIGTIFLILFFLAFLPFIIMFYIFKWSLKVILYLILIFVALGFLGMIL